jgi:hypothetical protein
MWWWRKVRQANIPQEQRDQFELFGEDVLAHAVGAGEHFSMGAELDARSAEKSWSGFRRDVILANEAAISQKPSSWPFLYL